MKVVDLPIVTVPWAAVLDKTFAPMEWRDVTVKQSRWLPRPPHKAMTVGHTIYVRQGETMGIRTLAHELAHVAQYDRWGMAGMLWRVGWQRMRYGYRNSPLEIEARQVALNVLRKGQA